jgi:uncharacterized protein
MKEDQEALEGFSGFARLFPLPGLVFFPHAIQPLHIFEPRYREMIADTLADDRLIALVLPKPGWEGEHEPAVHAVACLGRVIAEQLMPDGRYNLMLRGIARIGILDEPPSDKLYRIARAKILADGVPDEIEELMVLRTALADLILPRVTDSGSREQLQSLFKSELPLGHICDVLAYALPLSGEAKQELLELTNVLARARRLMEAFLAAVAGAVKPGSAAGKRFPPDFSAN